MHTECPQIDLCYVFSEEEEYILDITTEDRPYKLEPGMLPSQLFIVLTSHYYIYRQPTNSLESPSVSFKLQMQSTVLQNALQPDTESRALTSSEIDESHHITVFEQQISKLETEYRQKDKYENSRHLCW